jgi:hypothetical protein
MNIKLFAAIPFPKPIYQKFSFLFIVLSHGWTTGALREFHASGNTFIPTMVTAVGNSEIQKRNKLVHLSPSDWYTPSCHLHK